MFAILAPILPLLLVVLGVLFVALMVAVVMGAAKAQRQIAAAATVQAELARQDRLTARYGARLGAPDLRR